MGQYLFQKNKMIENTDGTIGLEKGPIRQKELKGTN